MDHGPGQHLAACTAEGGINFWSEASNLDSDSTVLLLRFHEIHSFFFSPCIKFSKTNRRVHNRNPLKHNLVANALNTYSVRSWSWKIVRQNTRRGQPGVPSFAIHCRCTRDALTIASAVRGEGILATVSFRLQISQSLVSHKGTSMEKIVPSEFTPSDTKAGLRNSFQILNPRG